jgi:hypothetical protein
LAGRIALPGIVVRRLLLLLRLLLVRRSLLGTGTASAVAGTDGVGVGSVVVAVVRWWWERLI